MLIGRVIMFMSGLTTINKRVKITPPKNKVGNPPVIFNPIKIWERRYKVRVFIKTFKTNDLILNYCELMLANLNSSVNQKN